MTTSIVYHTQGIRGFHYEKTVRKDQTEYYHIICTATKAVCPCCKSKQAKFVETVQQRFIRELPAGLKNGFHCADQASALRELSRFRP
ncbi:MAG: hypothetical protein AAF065_14870 [Verrucomicrobiota bacterium]